jgi:hypothetical protein
MSGKDSRKFERKCSVVFSLFKKSCWKVLISIIFEVLGLQLRFDFFSSVFVAELAHTIFFL